GVECDPANHADARPDGEEGQKVASRANVRQAKAVDLRVDTTAAVVTHCRSPVRRWGGWRLGRIRLRRPPLARRHKSATRTGRAFQGTKTADPATPPPAARRGLRLLLRGWRASLLQSPTRLQPA